VDFADLADWDAFALVLMEGNSRIGGIGLVGLDWWEKCARGLEIERPDASEMTPLLDATGASQSTPSALPSAHRPSPIVVYCLLSIVYCLSPITYHLSPITYHLSPITYHRLPAPNEFPTPHHQGVFL
jgi:hypothetical protein